MKKPAASWDAWAEQKDADDDGEEGEEEEGCKDYSPPTKQQCHVFEAALKATPGSRGARPSDVHELWRTFAKGPGAAQQRHALRNAVVPKNASYGHVCKIDATGPVMQRIKTVFEVRQRKEQMKGLTESEMLWKDFHGNDKAMQDAIDKNHIQVMSDMYYWKRDIHEHITGGKESFKFGGGEPQQMSQKDMDRMRDLLNFAPWAEWSATPGNIPKAELQNAAEPGSDAMTKAHECLTACQATCMSMKNFYKQVQQDGILKQPNSGSIPAIMSTAIKQVKDLETDHMKPIADVLYDPEGTTTTTVKDVKDMLGAAAKTLMSLTRSRDEAKAWVVKYKSGQTSRKSAAE